MSLEWHPLMLISSKNAINFYWRGCIEVFKIECLQNMGWRYLTKVSTQKRLPPVKFSIFVFASNIFWLSMSEKDRIDAFSRNS